MFDIQKSLAGEHLLPLALLLTCCSGGESGDTSATGGSSGTTGPNACLDITCDAPPLADCADQDTRREYAADGTCQNGYCRYAETTTPCPGGCDAGMCATNDFWQSMLAAGPPDARVFHSAVWTGSTMMVWGGGDYGGDIGFMNTGGVYDPAAERWMSVSTVNAPSARQFHSAVWTGSEMIVWGGYSSVLTNTGGRYDPATDQWVALSTSGAPSGRRFHVAIWTGSEMIVWGGDDYDNTTTTLDVGGRYDPATDQWSPISTTNAPAVRAWPRAVWTGSEMIVWGGADLENPIDTGGRYNPATDRWTLMSTTGAPSARIRHSAVWTGSEMIVWGGVDDTYRTLSSGYRYHPATDKWTQISTAEVPEARGGHEAVWTGSEMIVWGGGDGGFYSHLDTGGRYDPAADRWAPLPTRGAPSAREQFSALWTGSEMIVWGGFPLNKFGGRYVP